MGSKIIFLMEKSNSLSQYPSFWHPFLPAMAAVEA
jgi:hypothetical protein